MFRGTSFLNLDAKGRFAIPTRYRESLQSACDSHLVFTVEIERCLLIYPEPTWNEIERRLDRLPSLDAKNQAILRLYLGNAQDVDMDSQGRVLVPPTLREFASLDRRVVLVGIGKKFELWDEDAWKRNSEDLVSTVAQAKNESSPELASLNM